MTKPLGYSFLTLEEYKADIGRMSPVENAVFRSFEHKSDLNDTEQIIASLRCIIPDADELEKRFETLATDRGVTGKAYSASTLE